MTDLSCKCYYSEDDEKHSLCCEHMVKFRGSCGLCKCTLCKCTYCNLTICYWLLIPCAYCSKCENCNICVADCATDLQVKPPSYQAIIPEKQTMM